MLCECGRPKRRIAKRCRACYTASRRARLPKTPKEPKLPKTPATASLGERALAVKVSSPQTAPRLHRKATATPPSPNVSDCTDPPHHWLLDNYCYGVCSKCGAEKQYPRLDYVNIPFEGLVAVVVA